MNGVIGIGSDLILHLSQITMCRNQIKMCKVVYLLLFT